MSLKKNTYCTVQKMAAFSLVLALLLTVVGQSLANDTTACSQTVETEEDGQEQIFITQESQALLSNFDFDCSKGLVEVYELTLTAAPALPLPKPFSGNLFSSITKVLTHALCVNAP